MSGWGWILRWGFVPEVFHPVPGTPETYVTVIALVGPDGWEFRYILIDGREFLLSDSRDFVAPLDHPVEIMVSSISADLKVLGIPAFGIKADAVPGMLASHWFEAMRIGTYDAACSPDCIGFTIDVISPQAFDDWTDAMHAARGEDR